jgi:hypothetical protein
VQHDQQSVSAFNFLNATAVRWIFL